MRIALLYSSNPARGIALNKDLNGGLGTADDYGPSLRGRIFSWLKWKLVALPVVSLAQLQALLTSQGHEVAYYEDKEPDRPFELGLMYGSLVDFRDENSVLARLKTRFPRARLGFIGPFPERFPNLFPAADFVLGGEPEAFFLAHSAAELLDASGRVPGTLVADLNVLPSPDYTGFPIARYSYDPMLPKRPYLPLVASRGCPYSCGFYCTYPAMQGEAYRQRSAERVYADMVHLRNAYRVRSIQFRDPTFGLNLRFVEELCERLERNPLGVEWGIETRADLLSEPLLRRLKGAGLASLNLGIETTRSTVADSNHRKLVEDGHQRALVDAANRLGVRVNAFFMLALEGDTLEGLHDARNYALSLDAQAVRFCVSTPYPGTPFYAKLAAEGRLEVTDWERYTQFSLVFRHPGFTRAQVERELLDAYASFYFRPGYAAKTLFALLAARRPSLD